MDREEVAGVTTVSYAYDPNGSLTQKLDQSNLSEVKTYYYAYNAESFADLAEARQVSGWWKNHDNHRRPHSSLSYQPRFTA